MAVCVKLEGLVDRALELLLRPRDPQTPPIREIQEQIYLCRRKNGVWREEAIQLA